MTSDLELFIHFWIIELPANIFKIHI